ncbi:hypothetical protein RJ641_031410 [Dillenia turbinata]|uniref:Uncharacterized protein n=1 Tax=Dillenia turbinata TaxID=194707 RepID=A0AAN8W2I7_9MAGN
MDFDIANSDDEGNPIKVYRKVLDDLVYVNSLFSTAVYVGLSLTETKPTSLESRDECNAGADMAKRVVTYDVISFSFFLFSSLTAKTLKVFLNCHTRKELRNPIKKVVRVVMLLLSVIASVIGILFLMFSMVYVIQIRLGKLSCGTHAALLATMSMISIVSTALVIFVADASMAQRLVVCEVISFSFFLFSSIVAKTLEVYLNCHSREELKRQTNKVLRVTILLLLVCASIVGILFSVHSVVDIVQVGIGKLSCGSKVAPLAALSMILKVASALLIYVVVSYCIHKFKDLI